MSGRTFGELLRSFRDVRSLTQEELAQRAGLTVKAIGSLERGERRRPYPHTVRALSSALDLDPGAHQLLVASVPARARTPETHAAFRAATAGPSVELIGRDRELAEILQLLGEGRRRLITLTGPGGVGKTSLAREIARRIDAEEEDQVVSIDLSAVRDPRLVLPRIAANLGMPEGRSVATAESVATALSGRSQLVVLDNLEQLLDSAADLARLVNTAPGLRVLVTSRAPLRVRAEYEVRLEPLDVPESDSSDDVQKSGAAQLLIDRIAAAGQRLDLGSEMTPDTAKLLARACRRLDGLPLAIELAAARTRVLGLEGLVVAPAVVPELDGPRDLPDRQRTMAAAVSWSYDLLDAEAQELFAALSIFSGSFTLSAASALVDDEVIGPMTSLVEHSLVVRLPTANGGPRFRLLEPIREYATALVQGPERELLAEGHAVWFGRVAREAESRLQGRELVPALEELEADHDNLRSALTWFIDSGRHGLAAAMLARLWLYLALRDHAREGLAWLHHVDLERCDAAVAGPAHRAGAGLCLLTGEIPEMRTHAEAALALAREEASDASTAESLLMLANAEVFLRRTEDAAQHLDAALELGAHPPGSFMDVYRRLIDTQLVLSTGRLNEALVIGDETLRHARRLGNELLLCAVLNIQASATALAGQAAATATLLTESLSVSVPARLSWPLAYSLPALAGVAVTLGKYDVGARLFGASASFAAESAADGSSPVSREQAERDLFELRAKLGLARFRNAWDVGRAAEPDELVAWAEELQPEVSAHTQDG